MLHCPTLTRAPRSFARDNATANNAKPTLKLKLPVQPSPFQGETKVANRHPPAQKRKSANESAPAQQENQAPVWWLEHEDQAGPTCDIAGRPRAARDVLARGTRAGTGTRQRAGTARQTEAGRRGDRGRVGGRGQYVQQTHARRHACSEDS